MTVLILAQEFDPTADAVVTGLSERGVPVFRTDLAEFPRRLRLDASLTSSGRWAGCLWSDHRRVDLDDIRSVWLRNPRGYTFDEPQAQHEFCYTEARLGFGGVLAALDVLWANHPNRCADAIFKPRQWKLAVECGLKVAHTVITNDAASARRFTAAGDTITKALGPSGVTEQGQVKVAYIRRIASCDLRDPAAVSATATTLQRFVPKAFEVRLTVIGAEMFPVAIHAESEDARTDWRSDPGALTYEVISVPPAVADAVARYMKQTTLAYAGLDFVVTPDGQWVFLEANTGPQLGWLEAATGAPMVAAMATMLGEGRT